MNSPRLSFHSRAVATWVLVSIPIVWMGLFFFSLDGAPVWHGLNLWIVDKQGGIWRSNVDDALPLSWNEALVPKEIGVPTAQPARGKFVARPITILRLPGEPRYYLVARINKARIATFALRTAIPLILLSVLACLRVSLWYLKRREIWAARIIEALGTGNLSARFPISHAGEFGRAMMIRFNAMAEEIERLIAKLRQTEAMRTELLRELAHDVRIPLTSMRLAAENLSALARESQGEGIREDVTIVSNEIAYFERLIEDLFLLAQVENLGQVEDNAESLAITDLLNEQVAALRTASTKRGQLEWEFRPELFQAVELRANRHLMRRLFRNALDNASRFATSKVEVILSHAVPDGIDVRIRDDGPGFSQEEMARFGLRRGTRFIDFSSNNRVSLGLGSVIMRAIAGAYGGRIEVRNWYHQSGERAGAEITIHLPIAGELRTPPASDRSAALT